MHCQRMLCLIQCRELTIVFLEIIIKHIYLIQSFPRQIRIISTFYRKIIAKFCHHIVSTGFTGKVFFSVDVLSCLRLLKFDKRCSPGLHGVGTWGNLHRWNLGCGWATCLAARVWADAGFELLKITTHIRPYPIKALIFLSNIHIYFYNSRMIIQRVLNLFPILLIRLQKH